MIKSQIINQLAQELPDIPERDVMLSANSLLEFMSDALANGERIEVRGFGSFTLHYRASRNAHNPKTGAKVITQPKSTPHFKPGKELKERVDASKAQYPIQHHGDDETEGDI